MYEDNKTILKALASNAKRLYRNGEYDGALELLRKNSEFVSTNPDLLVLMGQLAQLSDTDEGLSLDFVERCYADALKIDPKSVPALLALGWYELNVNDNAEVGRGFFAGALRFARSGSESYVDGVKGMAACVLELQSKTDAEHFISSASGLAADQRRELLATLPDWD